MRREETFRAGPPGHLLTGRVISEKGAKQAAADLTVTEGNLMVAKLESPLSAAAKLIVSFKLSGGHDVKVQFVTR